MLIKMNKNIITVLFLSVGMFYFGQTTKEQKVADLLQAMGTTQTMKTSYEFFINSYKEQYPEIAEEYWQRAGKLVNYEDLIKRIIPVYMKNFSEKEIDDLLAFYQTTTGKAMIEKMPLILQESMSIGENWGRELAQKLERDISKSKEKSYSSPPPPMPSKNR